MGPLHPAPSAADLAAPRAGKVRRRPSVRINVSPRRTHDLGGAVRASQAGPAIGLIAQVLLLAVLAATVGLGAAGWAIGAACAVIMAVALARGLARRGGDGLDPSSWLTLARATLAVGVAALAADSLAHDTPVALLVTLAAVALVLDA